MGDVANSDGNEETEMSEDQMYEFKVRDFTRPLIGRMYRDGDARIYYVERGDGMRWEYEADRVEWTHRLFRINGNSEARRAR